MSDTRQKLDDLLAMGFIQPDEHAARLAAIEPSAASAPAAQPPHAQPQVQTTAAHSAKRFCKLELCESGCAQEQVRMGASERKRVAHFHIGDVAKSKMHTLQCDACGVEYPTCVATEHRDFCLVRHDRSVPCPMAYCGLSFV